MLGQDPRTNSIRVVVEGISQPVTFNAEGIRVPQELSKLSGDDQEGFPGETLPNPFVVQVRDHFDKPLEHVTVTFTVSVGAGTLTVTSSMTDTNGRAESELTLGSNAGTNSVSASASGIEKSVVFTSEGIRTPQSILKISGDSQEGIPNTKLPDPFIIEVQDKTGSSLEGVPVTFAVTNGEWNTQCDKHGNGSRRPSGEHTHICGKSGNTHGRGVSQGSRRNCNL